MSRPVSRGYDLYAGMSKVRCSAISSRDAMALLDCFPDDDPFQQRLQRAAATSLAENYVGLPFEW